METPTPESTEHTVATDGTVHPAEMTAPASTETTSDNHTSSLEPADPVMPEAPPIEGASEHHEAAAPAATAPEASSPEPETPAMPEPGTTVTPDSASHEGWRDQTVLPEPEKPVEPETTPAAEPTAEADSPAASAPAAAEIHGTTLLKTEDSPVEEAKAPEAAESTPEPTPETPAPAAETSNDNDVDAPAAEAAATPETDTRPAVEVAVEAVKRIFDEAPDIDTALEQWKELEDAQNERLLEKIKAHFESEHPGDSKAA